MKKRNLTLREQEFYSYRFGPRNMVKMTLTEVSFRMMITRQRAFQLEQAILKKCHGKLKKQLYYS